MDDLNELAQELRDRDYPYSLRELRRLQSSKRLGRATTQNKADRIVKGLLPLPASQASAVKHLSDMPGQGEDYRPALQATQYLNRHGIYLGLRAVRDECYAGKRGAFPGARFWYQKGWYIPQHELDAFIEQHGKRDAHAATSEDMILLTELARRLYETGNHISYPTLKHYAQQGFLPATKAEGKWWVPAETVEQIMQGELVIQRKKNSVPKPPSKMKDRIPEDYLSAADARQELGVSRQRFHQIVKDKGIRRSQIPGTRMYCYHAEDVEREAAALADRAAREKIRQAWHAAEAHADEEFELKPS
jgi:hypothetical protein